MGFLSKIFKPVSKVLDKIVPNEIKPFLPYAAAFAPMLAPGIMGTFGNSMMSRALMSGGLNLGSQLAQEGSEGDFNPLSVALAGGIGALSAPGAGNQIRGGNVLDEFGVDGVTGAESIKEGFMGKGQQYLGKAADFLSSSPNSGGVFDVVGPGGTEMGLNMATAKALGVPLAQGSMDKAYADAQLAMRDYENSEGGGSGYAEGDQNRGLAVRRAMERGGHEEQTIRDMLESLGYEDSDPQDLAYGGRVGYSLGNLVTGSGMFKPTSASMNAGDPRSTGGGSGIGGMVANMIGNNPQLFSNLGRSENISAPNNDIDFIDENQNGIDDRQEKAYGGRIGFAGGGMDYMPTEPSMMGNPAVIEVIEAGDDMRENRIMNPNVEDIADYSIDLKEKVKEPDFGGITEAVEKRPADSMLMQIAKEVGPMLLGLPGMAYLAGKSAYKMYQNLEKEDQDKVMDISEKIIKFGTPAGVGIQAGKMLTEKMTQNKKDGGMMSVLPKGMEMDYRGGGFIPMGSKERADDVPARVSKNEFVMTADAVKAAGGGSVNEGARRMYNLMNNLEARA